MKTAGISFTKAKNAAETLGKYLNDKVVREKTKQGTDRQNLSLTREAKEILQRIIHNPQTQESSDKQESFNLARVIANWFGRLAAGDTLTSIEQKQASKIETQAKRETQRKLDHEAGIQKLRAAEIENITSVSQEFKKEPPYAGLLRAFARQAEKRPFQIVFNLVTNDGTVDLCIGDVGAPSLGETVPVDIRGMPLPDDIGSLRLEIKPSKDFKLQTTKYDLSSAKDIVLELALKAFRYLKGNIEQYKSQDGINFEIFKANVETILAGLEKQRTAGMALTF